MIKSKVIFNETNGEEFISKRFLKLKVENQLRFYNEVIVNSDSVVVIADVIDKMAFLMTAFEDIGIYTESELLSLIDSFNSEKGENENGK